MFNLDQFVESCQGKPVSAVKELLAKALRDPASVKQALDTVAQGKDLAKATVGDMIYFRSPTLTILKAAVPPKYKTPPHNHTMWAVIGVCDGQENNTFYRRSGNTLEKAGGKELKTGDTVVLGEDAVHAIENPSDRPLLAIHVYGGDFLDTSKRSVWNPFTFEEHPYDFKIIRDFARQLMAQ
ncbi:MAG TPA: cysteine dioxygenase family protein [Candidatus Binataceae bacterium]|nr:cysteine dioxygenase family protein [Candidatus Binataceae bacterium]